jgi:phosphate transport system substrate-binding protein
MKPEELRQVRPRPVPLGDRRRGAGVNVPGVAPGKMPLTGPLLADMFLGKVKMWNDPAIVAANPGLTLPALAIRIVHRADASGTTFNFVNYLSKVSRVEDRRRRRHRGEVADRHRRQGQRGVATYVKQLKGGIGYVELSYALQNKMSYAAMQNAAGNWVLPSDDSFAAAAASADWTNSKDFYLVITNAPGEKSWPITATNFIIMYKQPKNAASAKPRRTSSPGPTPTATSRPRRSTTCRCRRRW